MERESKSGGIYCILNVSNGKRYIGSTIDLRIRMTWHKGRLVRDKHNNRYLQRAYNDNPNAFCFFIIEAECPEGLLLIREQYWMDLYKSYVPMYGYNICPMAGRTAGRKGGIPWNKGKKLGPQPRWLVEKRIAQIRGRSHSEETKRKISVAHKGKVSSLKGRPKSEETRRKLSVAHKGKPLSAEHIQKLREAWQRRIRTVSLEQKQKISISVKNWWNKRKMVFQPQNP